MKIQLPKYYVDIKDKRRLGKIHVKAREFDTLEEMAEWIRKNREKVTLVHRPSDNPFSHSLGGKVEEFEKYLKNEVN